MMRYVNLLISIVTILCITGCTETSEQDYPEHWSEIDQTVTGGCIQISGVYPAASMDEEMKCKQIKHDNWNYSIRRLDASCVFLPDAMVSWDNKYLPATETMTDHVIVEQEYDSITVNYVNQSNNYMRLSLQRDEDYTCRGNAITLIQNGKDKAENGIRGHGSSQDSRSFYKGKDGALIFEARYSNVRTSILPPFIKNTRTRVWAQWPLLPETVSDSLKRIKSQFLKHAIEAVERGDMGAAYRLIEDYLGSKDKGFRALSLEFFIKHPQMKPAAFGTFSIQSLEETFAAHGESAKAIEHARLQIYKTVATEEEYQQASENYAKVFPD